MIGTGTPKQNSGKKSDGLTYKVPWTGDAAIVLPELPAPPPEGATEDEQRAYLEAYAAVDAERDNLRRVARETQDFDPITREGESPSFFVFQWIDEVAMRAWNDQLRKHGGPMGNEEAIAQLFLLALVGVENVPNVKVPTPVASERFGVRMVPRSFLRTLRIHPGIGDRAKQLVDELGLEVYRQETETGPL